MRGLTLFLLRAPSRSQIQQIVHRTNPHDSIGHHRNDPPTPTRQRPPRPHPRQRRPDDLPTRPMPVDHAPPQPLGLGRPISIRTTVTGANHPHASPNDRSTDRRRPRRRHRGGPTTTSQSVLKLTLMIPTDIHGRIPPRQHPAAGIYRRPLDGLRTPIHRQSCRRRDVGDACLGRRREDWTARSGLQRQHRHRRWRRREELVHAEEVVDWEIMISKILDSC